MVEKIIFRPAAEADLRDAYHWYEACGKGLGAGFIKTVEDLVQRIRLHPEIYPVIYKHVRQGVLNRFPYSLLYLVSADTITVVSVFHSARDPEIWRRRVRG